MHIEDIFWCVMCKQHKTLDQFYIDNSRKTGVTSRCRSCERDYKKQKRAEYGWKYGHSENGLLIRRITDNLRNRLRSLMKHGSTNLHKELGCTPQDLKKHLESQFKKGMTWDNYGYGPGKWVIDHKRPISNFLKNGEDVRSANHYTNLGPLWWEENAAKSDKYNDIE